MSDKPLFIPLNTEYYEAFKDGSKSVEYRLCGKRWHKGTCYTGRAVTLSKGYGKKDRLSGFITGVRIRQAHELPVDVSEAIHEIYGEGNHSMICIGIGELR